MGLVGCVGPDGLHRSAAAWRLWAPGAGPRTAANARGFVAKALRHVAAGRGSRLHLGHRAPGAGAEKIRVRPPEERALREADRAALLGLLAADFRGEVLGDPREIALASDARPGDCARRRSPAGRVSRWAASAFVGRLLEYRRRFVGPPDMDVALMTLSPETPANEDGPWKGEVQLRMWGGMGPAKARPKSFAPPRSSAAPDGLAGAADAAGAGRSHPHVAVPNRPPDAGKPAAGGWLRGCSIRQSLASEAPHFLFKDVTAERGIDAGLFYDNWTRGSKPLVTITGGVYLTRLRPRRLPRHARSWTSTASSFTRACPTAGSST